MITKKQLVAIQHPGFKALVQKAVDMNIDVCLYTNCKNLTRFKYKGHVIYANNNFIPLQSQLGNFTMSKEVTKTILNECNIPVPHGIFATNATEAIRLIKKNNLSYPLILKPVDGSLSKGITWNIISQQKLKEAVQYLNIERNKYTFLKKHEFIVEEMVFGKEYRVLVLKNKVISCVKRLPATIIGNGIDSIKKLITIQNKSRLKKRALKLDDVAKKHIKQNGFTIYSKLPKSYELILRDDVSIDNGGRVIDYTQQINSDIKKECVKAVKALGLVYGGIDLISKDITKNTHYHILEINSKPAHILNEKPIVEGEGVDVSLLLLQELFPNLKK